jgi:hypothetical protein
MITSSMTYKEMYDHLAADLGKVEYRKAYYLPKAVREFRKAIKFPVWKWYEYKVPSTNNKYVIFYYAENADFVEKPKTGFYVDVFYDRQRFVVKWGASGYRHTPTGPIKAIRQIHAYTSHFLHRYNERCLKDDSLSTNDIACRYLSRNDIAMPIEINESINKNIEDYGEGAKQGFRVRDGICFTRTGCEGDRDKNRVDAMVIVYTTFMSEYKMTDSQRLAIDKEHWEKWTQSFMDFIKESNNGVLSLKLEP